LNEGVVRLGGQALLGLLLWLGEIEEDGRGFGAARRQEDTRQNS
jgi:hypothetical protein